MRDYTRRPDDHLGESIDAEAYAVAHKMAKIRGHINRRRPDLYDATSTILCIAQLFALLNTNPVMVESINSVLNRTGCHWRLVPSEPAK